MRPDRAPRTRALAAVALLLCLAAGTVPALADPRDRLDRIEERQRNLRGKIEHAERRQGELLGRIESVDADRARVESTVSELDDQLAGLNARIADVEGRLERTQQELALLGAKLTSVERRLERREGIFEQRAVEVYKAGPTAYLDTLVTSESVADLVSRYSYYESALDAERRLLDEIDLLRSETAQHRSDVESKEDLIAADKRRLEADRAAVAEVRAEKAAALSELEDVLAEKESLLAAVKSKRSRYESVQDQLERESDQIEALLAARAEAAREEAARNAATPAPDPGGGGGGGGGGGPAPVDSGGRFTMPAAGPITSPFGYRTHPIFGDTRLHTGIDIAAPYGSTVVAAGPGTVAYVGVMSGYGNVVVVDHGGGIATTYNHLSGFSVGTGQRVGRGSPIASVGCTGYCTGPHLHFEVRVNGTPVDPMPYL
ncbi:MAG TPA: peptidoglycan DD-metalloendopeptidase family protein [Actinomycetota bacterium]|nr:peptidoglycan DD-metalloendopeptidase family protein [Actinomycetota bacterium]